MANKIHPNITALRELKDQYGVDALLEATGYTMLSLAQYMRPNGKVIPDKKLKNVRIILEATSKQG